MIYFCYATIVCLIAIIVFLVIRLAKAGDQLLKLDDLNEQTMNELEKAEIILKHAHEELLKVSKYPVVSDEPIVSHLNSVINIAKNEIQSTIDDLINFNKE